MNWNFLKVRQSLKDLMFETKSELDRLELILQIKKLFVQNSGYKIPFVHPKNIFLMMDSLILVIRE